ncbi:MAG: 16S rRNA processing protein RimM [Spirochaeta sp. LUC14_002_19_P3]|nr:MAG: 16S rRNA processing protein RimM [Spirochaeta sp. LUC14_002_19_P3]
MPSKFSTEPESLIAIGSVRTSFGVHGWVKVASHSGEWPHFYALNSVVLEDVQTGNRIPFEIEGFTMHHGGGILKFAGLDSPEKAKMLAGREILAAREFAAPLGADEWYLKDLTGLAMVTEQGGELGKIVGVIEAADDILEVRRGDGSSFMVPFRQQFVSEPDFAAQTIVLFAPWLAE